MNCQEFGNGRKLSPNVAVYQRVELGGGLQVITARNEGKLIAYHICFIQPHMHHTQILCAVEDSSYIAPNYRFGRVALKLIQVAEEHLATRGVQEIYFTVAAEGGTGRMIESLGFKPCSTIYSKRIYGRTC